MYETIILAICLTQTPSICKEVNIGVEPDPTGSLQLPFHCARRGQMEAQQWIVKKCGRVIPTASFASRSDHQG